MEYNFKVDTEGVLILASQLGLKKYFKDKELDYDYPEGILPLINSGNILAITTESGNSVCLKIFIEENIDFEDFQNLGTYQLDIQENDTFFILDHASFTQICDWHKGDINEYDFDEVYNPKLILEDIASGWYKIYVYGKEVDFEENECYLEIILVFESIAHKINIEVRDVLSI